MIRFFILILLVGLLTISQSFGFSVFDIKPNLALIAIVAALFFTDFWQGILLIVFAALILKFGPGLENEILVFSLIGIGANFVKKYLPWQNFLNNLFLIGVATFIFYLILSLNLIWSVIFAKELFLNFAAGILIFAFLSFLWKNK